MGRCPISEADISACENVVNLTRLKKKILSPSFLTPEVRVRLPKDSQTARGLRKTLAYCRSRSLSLFTWPIDKDSTDRRAIVIHDPINPTLGIRMYSLFAIFQRKSPLLPKFQRVDVKSLPLRSVQEKVETVEEL